MMELTNGNGVVHSNDAIGLIRGSDIVHEMQGAYLDYAMSVIVARALPDVRDGLKPVHRRILYAMYHDLGLDHTKPHKKSARIVGEVLGKYHPHGDTAVYDAMVRMAQEFSLRYPLVDGQGNFGSVDGDNAAAMRYTEARLSEISQLVLADLDKDTVDWHDNFDNSLREPDILPSALPNLLINGSSGIAVGMATNVPPHNLGEVVDALAYLIDHYDAVESITVEQLMQFVKGPDFPTGGILYRYRDEKGDDNVDVIAQSYSVGRSRLVMQAKAHFEEMSRGRSRIVVTELPYQTNKVALIERIASLVRDGKIEGITDLRDESDRAGMRMVIELTRNVEPKVVLADLFKQTPLQQTFGLQMLALVDGEPRTLSLKRMLQLFVQHRQEIIRRRSEYDLKRARERAHILEGLLRALDILDQVIDTIRRSQNAETARNNLVSNFKFTEIQAQAILDMQLRRLAALERRKLQEEHKELLKQIAYLEDLLAHPAKILGVIKEDLLAIKEKYGDARRTQIVDRTKGTLTTTDLLPDQEVWVTVSANGDLRRQDTARASATGLRQVGKGSEVALLTANTRDYLYLFARDGRCRRVSIHEIPQSGEDKHLAELTDFSRRDAITAALTLPRTGNTEGYLFMVTEQGMVKRVTLADFMAASASADLSVMNVEEKDKLVGVFTTAGEQEVMLVSNEGQSIRFAEEDARSMGLAAGGVGGMRLKKGYGVIYAAPVDPEGELLTITAQGYAKRTPLSEYSSQGRNGGGIVTHKLTSRTGAVTAALLIGSTPPEALIVVPRKGSIQSVELEEVPVMGRGVQGKQIVNIGDTNPVVALRGIWSSYQTALENRVVVEEAEEVAIGAVKKVSPFAKAGGATAANGTTNGTADKAITPSDNGNKPMKPTKAEATPAPSARKSVAKAASLTPSKVKVNDVPAPTPKREKVEREAVKVKAGVPVAKAKHERTKREAPKAKAEVVEPTPKRNAAQREATKVKADVSVSTPERERTQPESAKAKAEVTTPTSKRERVQREAPKADQPTASPRRESVKREVPKAKAAAKKPEQPQQPSLLPDDKSLEAAPRRNQKLAAVTSVKRPKK
jgi:DNA gyrase subunit A